MSILSQPRSAIRSTSNPPFEREDFPPDERMADHRILVNEVSYAHGDFTCIR